MYKLREEVGSMAIVKIALAGCGLLTYVVVMGYIAKDCLRLMREIKKNMKKLQEQRVEYAKYQKELEAYRAEAKAKQAEIESWRAGVEAVSKKAKG